MNWSQVAWILMVVCGNTLLWSATQGDQNSNNTSDCN